MKKQYEEIMCLKIRELQGKTAMQILNFCGVENECPIDLDKILKKLGILYAAVDFKELLDSDDSEEIWGAVLLIGDDVGIAYSSHLKENGRRFTVAHEIAHCCLETEALEQGEARFRAIDTKNQIINPSPKEIEANIFAGELLMPEHMVREVCNKFIIPEISALSEIFCVSKRVVEERLKRLGISYVKQA